MNIKHPKLFLSFLFFISVHVHPDLALALTCQEALRTVHGEYLLQSKKPEVDLVDLLLHDQEISEKLEQNEFLPAYLVARFQLDHTLPDEIKNAILTAFQKPDELNIKPETLSEIDQLVSQKLAQSEFLAQTKAMVSSLKTRVFNERIQQAKTDRMLSLGKTLREFNQLLNEEFTFSKLDANLFAQHGFHMVRDQNGNIPKVYQQRPWNQVNPKGLSIEDVQNMSPLEYAGVALFAKEVEDPIVEYSGESGNALQNLLPKLGRFMGKTNEQMIYAYEQNPSKPNWCESPWCEEEKRHGQFLAKIVERFTGKSAETNNANEVSSKIETLDQAFQHLISRGASEWSASSAYLYLASHSKRNSVLQNYILNLARDEIKHLSILSGAYLYLMGPQMNKRMTEMLKINLRLMKGHEKNRTTGADVFSDPLAQLEVVVIYAMMEMKIRTWVQSLPFSTLKTLFDGPSLAPKIEGVKRSDEEQAKEVALHDQAALMRETLGYWTEGERKKVFEQQQFEAKHAGLIKETVQSFFKNFAGMENPESTLSIQAFKKIKKIPFVPDLKKTKLFQKVLTDQLRNYQIMNNFIQLELSKNPVESIRFGGRQANTP